MSDASSSKRRTPSETAEDEKNAVVIKVGMVGDSQVRHSSCTEPTGRRAAGWKLGLQESDRTGGADRLSVARTLALAPQVGKTSMMVKYVEGSFESVHLA